MAWAAMLGPAAGFLVPAGKAVTGLISTQFGKGGQGLLTYVESKLRRMDQENKAVKELVRSRVHVVVHLRPMLNPRPAVEETPPKPTASLFSRWFGSVRDHDISTRNSGAFPDICRAWCAPKRAPSEGLPGLLEFGQAAPEGLDMGEGAERHELVLCKSQGYVCVDYKGMMYRMISPEGKTVPGGAKAFRLNVMYDILRSAAQSGEYEVDSPGINGSAATRQAVADEGRAAPPGDAAEASPPSESPASNTDGLRPPGGDGQGELSTKLALNSASGLSEAMAYTKRVMLRAEVLCLRGGDVLFASYFDTLFTRKEMLSGTLLHANGKDDESNPYCKFVNDQTSAILAQCEILYAADLNAATATSGSAPETPAAANATGGKAHANSKIAGCFQSFSRIQDVASLAPAAVTSTLMPWLGKYAPAMSSLTSANKAMDNVAKPS